MKLIGYIVIGFVVVLWLYAVVVTEPPYGLDATPPTHWFLTGKNVPHGL